MSDELFSCTTSDSSPPEFMTTTSSTFEHLPNELLLYVFTYCRPRDLFVSLFNLNHRLNSLIYVQSLNVDLGNALPKYLLDLYYKSVLHNAREQIHTLRLSDTYGRMRRFVGHDQEIEIDFSTRRLILDQVKYLILWDPIMSSLHQVLQYVNKLEYLQVTSIGRARQTPGYTNGLLKTLFQMNRLKRLSLALHDSIVFNEDIGTNDSLTHLTLNGCHMQHLAPLLRRLPNLRRLNIMCYNRPNFSSVVQEHFDFSLYDGIADCVPHLTHLILHVTHTAFFEIQALLEQLPKLIKLSFSSLLVEDYANGFAWERVIRDFLPNLQKFSLFINETHIPSRFHVDTKRIIQSFSSLFWQSWPVVLEYCAESASSKHLMLYTLPSQKDSVRTYLYNLQTETTRDNIDGARGMEKFDYKKVYELHFTLHTNPLSKTTLPPRVYSNLKSLSFSSQLTVSDSYDTETICNDLQRICSTTILSNIKRIYLYDKNYPKDFLSRMLQLLPNAQSLRVCASLLSISTVLTRVTSLTIDLNSSPARQSHVVLRQIGQCLPNVRYLYLDLVNANDIFILLIYCLRKLVHLLDIHVTLNETNARFDRPAFLAWFDEFKLLDRLNSRVQVEFGDDDKRLHISL